ncbi:acetolactate synthase 2 catalytic subunit [Thalassotalea sp. ND16A]|uniref:acetolactate synthase 2 catalytic subunit n=1 Tax=Thalassotalea sp. ND16A TaxID=1535422 RepID=UPI00051A1E1E|nr:acetolactate synthase 2 catalytic subunit [Thalassotalea sp. ND16A]KGJ88108.1 Acetolactate synthase [Thalassotalea sp. ND16A]
MTGAELTLQILQQHGVDSVFGYPGGAIMPLYDAIYDSPIKHFLCRHEQGAAFAAVGYARASKKVGVCLATSGPGATNLITGLADAMSDSVPVVAITGQVPTVAMGSDAFQEVDIIGLSLAVTKHCVQVTNVEDIPTAIEEAISIALSGRMGPVLIDIPKDIQVAETQVGGKGPMNGNGPTAVDCHHDLAIEQAKTLISQAKKPVLYVGGGVGMADAVSELREFSQLSKIPSVSTLKGLGTVAADDEYYLGMLGMHGTKAANYAVQQCDLLIAVGARFDDRVTGKLKEFASNAKVIHFDIDQAEVNKRRLVDVALLGDLKVNLPATAVTTDIAPWQQYCRRMIIDFAWQYDHPGEKIFAPALLNKLSQLMPDTTVVTTDVGQHQMWTAQHMAFAQPENFLSSGGQGAMGFGLPAAIGAQVSRPNDTVIAVSGDGSFMMNVQELATLKRYGIPVKIVLIDNARLGMVRQWQQIFFEERYSETDLSDNPDFVMLAQAFDIKGQVITTKQQVDAALKEMLAHDGPYLLQVRIDELDNVWPLVPPNAANEAMLESVK